jgi:MoaA/NifB/PqqE/SkfB family radical SAM enzyme
MENVKSFIDAGGKAEWSFLIFKHNEHQIEETRKISKDLGFKKFEYAFSERWQDFNSNGEYRDINQIKVDDYLLEKPNTQPYNFVKTDDTGTLTKSKNEYHNVKNNFFSKKIRCWACNENKKEIYLRANGYVSPCCILGDVERNEPSKIINDYKKINLHHTDLKTILEGDFFKDLQDGINGGEKRLQGCYHACGVK